MLYKGLIKYLITSSIILLSIITVFICAYVLFPPPWFPEEIEGCGDLLALNGNENVTIHNPDSCRFASSLPLDLQKKIDKIRKSDWDEIEYKNIKTAIYAHFTSLGLSGNSEETNTILNLDSDYMHTIKAAAQKVAKKCFNNSSDLRNEITRLYKTSHGKKNVNLKDARSLFNQRGKIGKMETRFKNLKKKKYDDKSAKSLRDDVNTFMNSTYYKKYLKNCKQCSFHKVYHFLE